MKSILVIGAGIAGSTVAERLSREGWSVYLIEKQDMIGGRVIEMGCKATDVCLRCNVCVAHDLLRNVAASSDIKIFTRTELGRLEVGENGSRYSATLRHKPTFIDRNKCIGCRACMDACPEKCIQLPKVAVSPVIPVVDYSSCRRIDGRECSECERVCPVDAIDMNQSGSESKVDVDSVVIAAGYEPFNPTENASYGYGKIANVISGVDAERQLAMQNRITRPSDGKPPKRIAFIQCVGSRSEEVCRRPEDTDYCSTVCCSYALRIARLIRYLDEEAKITVFYMDIQNFGKGFDEFYEKCRETMSFFRSRPYEIKDGQDGNLLVKFTPQSFAEGTTSQVREEEFDLVILAVGIRPNPDLTKLAESLLVPVDEYGFLGFKGASPLPEMQREGVFAVGACESPKDIQSSMAQAEAVCAAVKLEERGS